MNHRNESTRRPLASRRGRGGRLARFGVVLAVLGVTALLSAGAAQATTPVQFTFTEHLTVQDPTVCGFGIRWDITATLTIQEFFDAEGNPIFDLAHGKEHNILTNLTTGKTVSDNPVYEERARFDAEGNLVSFDTMGLWVNAREGGDSITDVGRVSFAYLPDGSEVTVFSAGQHPFREVSQGDLTQGLAAFCGLLS